MRLTRLPRLVQIGTRSFVEMLRPSQLNPSFDTRPQYKVLTRGGSIGKLDDTRFVYFYCRYSVFKLLLLTEGWVFHETPDPLNPDIIKNPDTPTHMLSTMLRLSAVARSMGRMFRLLSLS